MNSNVWKQRVQQLKNDTYALYLAYQDPRTPWYARLWVVIVVGYALSPIDLIPDFIPVLGYLDDLILIPLGMLLAIRLIPAAVLADCRAKAQVEIVEGGPAARVGLAIILAIWLVLAVAVVLYVTRIIR